MYVPFIQIFVLTLNNSLSLMIDMYSYMIISKLKLVIFNADICILFYDNVAITHYIIAPDNYFHNYYLQSSKASTNTYLKRLEKNVKYFNNSLNQIRKCI